MYQPYILADDVEVGEGQNLRDAYKGVSSAFDLNTFVQNKTIGDRLHPDALDYFRESNEQYRTLYAHIADYLAGRFGPDLKNMSFAEFGCNTGLNLFNLAVRGAKECHGFDWTNHREAFSWLNEILGTDVRFTNCRWDNLRHTTPGVRIPEVDVQINTVFMNHQCDLLQFLSHIADRAKRGMFLWMLVEEKDICALVYPERPSEEKVLKSTWPFPLYFNNEVRPTRKLLYLSLAKLGFEKVEEVPPPKLGGKWDEMTSAFKMFYVERTSSVKSAYYNSKVPYEISSDIRQFIVNRPALHKVAKKIKKTISRPES